MRKLIAVPTPDDILEAHREIRPYIHRTPVFSSSSINLISGAEVYFKCENFQKVGAFKIRGATCAVLALNEREKSRGICTHSSGNHAQAVALSARRSGIKAFVVMPCNAPRVKRAATEGYGAEVILCEPTLEARESTLAEIIQRTGATEIHSYNNYNIIAGQATAAKELIEDVPELEAVMAPVGGGGLISGTALTIGYFLPGATVIGTEPELVNDAFRSFTTGKIQYNTTTNTIADGLRTNLGEKSFDIITNFVDDIITVSEKEIIDAMRLIWERMKIVVEPSSAVPLAALIKQKHRFAGQRIGIILSGGNVDVTNLPF